MDNNFYDKNYLQKGTLLNKIYVIESVIGAGGFGVTYLAHLKNNKNSKYSIKEFLPINIIYRNPDDNNINIVGGRFQEYEKDRNLFRNEFENLEKIKNVNGIIPPVEYFEENKTNYIVTDYKKCITFSDYISLNGGKLNIKDTLKVIYPLMDILENIHNKFKMYHKDIRPENILIEEITKKIFLIDFGIAYQNTENQSHNITVKISDGYSPLEQYKKESFSHGPWMDVYSTAATIYKSLTGKRVPSVFDRIDISFPDYSKKILEMPSEKGIKIHTEIEKVLKMALEINYQKRFQSIKTFKYALITSIETTKNGIYDLASLEYKKITKLKPPSILRRLLYKKAQMKDSKNDLLKKLDEFNHLKNKFYYEMEDLLFTALSIEGKNKIFLSSEEFKEILKIVYYNIDDKIYKSAKHKYEKITNKTLPTPLERYYNYKKTGHDLLNLSNKYKIKKTAKFSLLKALSLDLNERYKDIREYSANLKLSYFSYLTNTFKNFIKSQFRDKKNFILFTSIILISCIILYMLLPKKNYEDKIIFINTKPELAMKLKTLFLDINKDIIICSENEYINKYKNKTFKVIRMLDEDDILKNKNKNIYYNLENTNCIKDFKLNKNSGIDFIKTLTKDKIDVIKTDDIIAIPFAIEGFGMIYNKNNIHPDLNNFKDSMFTKYSNGISSEDFLSDLEIFENTSNNSIAILPLDWLYGRHYMSLGLISNNKTSFLESFKDGNTQIEDYPTYNSLLSFYKSILDYNFLSNNMKYSTIEKDYINLIENKEFSDTFSTVENQLYNEGITLFTEEGVFCISGTWIWPLVEKSLKKTDNKDDFGIVPIPVTNDKNNILNKNIVCGITKYLVVEKFSESEEMDKEIEIFLNTLSTTEYEKKLCSIGILPPFYNFSSSQALINLNSDDPLIKSMIYYINGINGKSNTLYYESIEKESWEKIGLEMQKLYEKEQGINWTFDRIRIHLSDFLSNVDIGNDSLSNEKEF